MGFCSCVEGILPKVTIYEGYWHKYMYIYIYMYADKQIYVYMCVYEDDPICFITCRSMPASTRRQTYVIYIQIYMHEEHKCMCIYIYAKLNMWTHVCIYILYTNSAYNHRDMHQGRPHRSRTFPGQVRNMTTVIRNHLWAMGKNHLNNLRRNACVSFLYWENHLLDVLIIGKINTLW